MCFKVTMARCLACIAIIPRELFVLVNVCWIVHESQMLAPQTAFLYLHQVSVSTWPADHCPSQLTTRISSSRCRSSPSPDHSYSRQAFYFLCMSKEAKRDRGESVFHRGRVCDEYNGRWNDKNVSPPCVFSPIGLGLQAAERTLYQVR